MVKTEFLGKKQVPPEIPIHQAVALGAFAQAHARGISKARRVFDLVAAAPAVDGLLVVVAKGGAPRLAAAHGFEPTAAVVIDLDTLIEAIRSDGPIPA